MRIISSIVWKSLFPGAGIILVFLLGCASHIGQFYPDDFFVQDNVYENKTIGFSLTYRGKWIIETDPEKMNKSSKEFAKELKLAGAELLYAGFTAETTQGTRGIAANLNMPAMEYAQKIQELNKSEIDEDFGITEYFTQDREMARWEYRIGDFHFVEFFIECDTYDVRIAFWTRTGLFPNFIHIYEDIVSSVVTIGRY